MKTPTIDELIGKIIETRDGCRYIVVGKQGDVFALAHDGYLTMTKDYDENLKDIATPLIFNDGEFDIMKVYECEKLRLEEKLEEVGNLIWEREEAKETVKEMTIADVEKLVGSKVKIVK